MTNDIDLTPKPWSRRRQKAGVIVWSSFLAACVATMVFFAIFDPLLLGDDDQPPAWLPSHMTGYALGFFFFLNVTKGTFRGYRFICHYVQGIQLLEIYKAN